MGLGTQKRGVNRGRIMGMRVLALDVGTKTIGVAVSDELGIIAHGVCTIRRAGREKDIGELRKVIERYSPERIVLGVPYLSDGRLSKRGERIVEFGALVERELGIPVVHWDESFTTSRAKGYLLEAGVGRAKSKRVIDKMAAVVILREYLESLRAD